MKLIQKIYIAICHPKHLFHYLNLMRIRLFFGRKQYVNHLYRKSFGRNIDWQHPTEMNEKIRWMQFNYDTSLWTLLADKYRVRQFLIDKGYGGMLVRLYGVWSNAKDIDFTKLPQQFVIKTNHGCGSVYIIKNKDKSDLEEIRAKLLQDIKHRFGSISGEYHYLSIPPIIIAEELLVQKDPFSSSLVDYKFYCVCGKPMYCAVMYNRNIIDRTYDVKLYDMKWQDCSEKLSDKISRNTFSVPKPYNLESMINFCKDVCKNIPFVRVDFYEVNGRMYFGEFTFTPAACTGGSLGKLLCDEIGAKITLKSN